ncbi:MAG TPA: NF038129 family PEP-CTERM protein [Casimicrobiaceae bacterium]|nr:NF038129 family PEP-CTERM protein [Casimicrobiaceae bacterium]
MTTKRWEILVALAGLLAAIAPAPASAGPITGSVSLDTSGLSGPFEIAFVFIDGSGTGDANNTVTLSDFAFGAGGSAGTVDTTLTTGGVSGDLGSGVSIVDSDFLNIFASSFTPGSVFSFDFSITTNVDAGGTPDQLSMVLLLPDGTPVATTDPSGIDALLTLDIDSASPQFATFASEVTPAPVVTLSTTVPEPTSVVLLTLALGLLSWIGPGRRSVAGSA